MDNNEHFKQIFVSAESGSNLLKDYINYYYFQETGPEDFISHTIYYPHYGHALNIYRNADLTWSDEGRIITACDEDKQTVLYTTPKYNSRVVTMKGINFKIGIIFKPLGFNHFIDCKLSDLVSGVISPLNYFGQSFNQLADKIYDEPNIDKRISMLDKYFIKRYLGFEEELVTNAVNLILKSNAETLTQDIAKSLGVNRKTLTRLFNSHLTYTPRQFKSIVKFRKAIDHFKSTDGSLNLAELAHESGYYDQSEFINRYKALVGMKPSELYKRIKAYGSKGTYWTRIAI